MATHETVYAIDQKNVFVNEKSVCSLVPYTISFWSRY